VVDAVRAHRLDVTARACARAARSDTTERVAGDAVGTVGVRAVDVHVAVLIDAVVADLRFGLVDRAVAVVVHRIAEVRAARVAVWVSVAAVSAHAPHAATISVSVLVHAAGTADRLAHRVGRDRDVDDAVEGARTIRKVEVA
jgi:hypothetical protein